MADRNRGRRGFFALDRYKDCLERLAAGFRESSDEVPIGGRPERHPLPFALDDQSHGNALYASGRETRPNFLHSKGETS